MNKINGNFEGIIISPFELFAAIIVVFALLFVDFYAAVKPKEEKST